MIRARSQYLPPDEKTSLETSYSATYKGQAPLRPAGNKALDRRRIRSLYSEPYIDPIKQVRTRLCSKVQNQFRKGRIKRKSLYYCNVNFPRCSSHCTSTVLETTSHKSFQSKHFNPGISFPLSDILRLTDTVPFALNPKSLEPLQQARSSRRRKPKISKAPG